MDDFLTTEEIASILKVNVITIRRYIEKGLLPALFFGKEYRIKKDDFQKFLDKRKVKQKR